MRWACSGFDPIWAARRWVSADWLDTALFDIDGVLIDTSGSYRRSVIQATEYLVRASAGLTGGPEPLVTPEDVLAFKMAGGFNSDWDLTPALAGLWTARLREWRGDSRAERPLSAWAADALAATRAGRGGVIWLRATVPASALPDWEMARWVHDELYWGAAVMRRLYRREPQYAPDALGFARAEEPLLTPETLPALAALGIARYGVITGRISPEVEQALRLIAPEGESAGDQWPARRCGAPTIHRDRPRLASHQARPASPGLRGGKARDAGGDLCGRHRRRPGPDAALPR